MRLGAFWAAWACVGVVWTGGQGLFASLPEAGRKLTALKAKLSELEERTDLKRRNGFPGENTSKKWNNGAEEPWGNTTRNRATAINKLDSTSPGDRLKSLREILLDGITVEERRSTSQSLTSIAFLAFGVILFDVLVAMAFPGAAPRATSGPREALLVLPGLGLFGDRLNGLAEVVLNAITVYIYRDESPDCGERLLCESNLQAINRGFLDALATYVGGFAVSFFLLERAPLSRSLEAMRAGRKGRDCIGLYPRCSVTL